MERALDFAISEGRTLRFKRILRFARGYTLAQINDKFH